MGSSFFSASTLNFQITQVLSFLKISAEVRSSGESFAVLRKGNTVNGLLGGLGWLGDHVSRLSIVDHKDIGDDDEQKIAISTVGAAVNDIGVGGLWLGLNKDKLTICSDHF